MSAVTIMLSDGDLARLKHQLVDVGNTQNFSIKIDEAVVADSPVDIKYLKGKLI